MANVLVVDDEPVIALMVVEWLAEQGIQALGPAHTVAQAIALIEEGAVDAAVLDVSLAEGNSYAAADLLVEKGIPFAFATGHGVEGLDERFRHVLTVSKPFNFDVVQRTVATLLKREAPA